VENAMLEPIRSVLASGLLNGHFTVGLAPLALVLQVDAIQQSSGVYALHGWRHCVPH
jgi:hypothetical protein